jgi:hypothetical protein
VRMVTAGHCRARAQAASPLYRAGRRC